MIGAVIVTHGRLAGALFGAAEGISGKIDNVRTVEITGGEATEDVRESLAAAISEVDSNKGVIILTDMFGGTPSNIALSFLKEGSVEILTGVNLPLFLKFLSFRRDVEFLELVTRLVDYGQKSIVLASGMLKEK